MKPAYRHSHRPVPGIHWGSYPELDAAEGAPVRGQRAFGWPGAMRAQLERRVAGVQAAAQRWRLGSDASFLARRGAIEDALVREAMSDEAIDTALAFAAEAARRVLALTAHDCQLYAALAILDNRLVEMATGEGKSLAAALAAAVGALAGIPVHVLTANDYLVERDAERFDPLYTFLGLAAAPVVAGQPAELRRMAYAQPVVYVTAKELVFDYLRDRLRQGAPRSALGRRARALASAPSALPLLRGLCMAVVDEADSILIDEALMPLVLSRPLDGAMQRALYWQAHALAGRLAEGEDFVVLAAERRVELTPFGGTHIDLLSAQLQPAWKNRRHRDETIVGALTAQHLFKRDRDYLVTDDGEVRIVDAVTGRTAAERKWSRGLHALVALKEGCRVEPDLETLAQITFQRFFRRYIRFGGMSGTLAEARGELQRVYGAPVVGAALHRPSRRMRWPTRWYADDAARREAVVARVRDLRAAGRPVLIGCDSVAASQALSARLRAAGLPHAVLNARHDRDEAEIVARAGIAGQVTVATHMAGRGTDIHLDAAALAAGGLHVIACQHNPSRRHDRQLAGRAGRQGEPGSAETWVSLEAMPELPAAMVALLRRLAGREGGDGRVALPGLLLAGVHALRQRWAEASQARQRRQLLAHDEACERGLAFCDFRE